MHQVQLPLFNELLVHLLTMGPCSIAPICYRSLIQAIGMHNGLDWASIREQRDDNHDEIHRFAQALQHRSPTGTEGVFADLTAVALPFAIMNDDIALCFLASCRTRRVRAKLLRRVHRLCQCLHIRQHAHRRVFVQALLPFSPDSGVLPFDLVIVDECHRGSARDESNWREILEYFEPAFQLGMTATPKRRDNADTYHYFGPPIYTYSLRQGIDDGFLAPYPVHRIVTTWDAAGWRPSKGDLDRFGREIPDDEYHTRDFERTVSLRARTEAGATDLPAFLKATDRYAKTLVFCMS